MTLVNAEKWEGAPAPPLSPTGRRYDAAPIENFRTRQRLDRALTEGIDDMSAGPTIIAGELKLDGAGEQLIPVNFTVPFSEKPILSHSFEVKEGDVLVSGSYPTASVGVAQWATYTISPQSLLYIGANLVIVTTGVWYQKLIVNWQFQGIAYQNPV